MQFHDDFLCRYLQIAPAALALERSYECKILSEHKFARPVLDIGCGDGVFAAILFKGRINTGIDPDNEELDRARPYDKYEELIQCLGNRIPKPDGHYQTIFSNSVLEHIEDIESVLKEACRLLASDGYLYLTLPTDRLEHYTLMSRLLLAIGLCDLEKKYAAFYNRFWKHYHAYPEYRWRELFVNAGFTVEEEKCYSSKYITTVYDLLTVVALPSMISKLIFKRWIAFPVLRKTYSDLICRVLALQIRKGNRQNGGPLVFYSLSRK